MRRLFSDPNIDNVNIINQNPLKSGSSSLDSSFTLSQQGKSVEKSTFRKFESLDKNTAFFDKKPSSEQNISDVKSKMLDTLQFLTLPSIRPTNDSEVTPFPRQKKTKQSTSQQNKSAGHLQSIQKSDHNVIFYRHTEAKEVSLQKLKDKSSSYKRLQFKKKNQYESCKAQDIENLINRFCKNSSKQAKSVQLISNQSSNIEEFCQSKEMIREMLHSSEVKPKRQRKISFRQTSLKENQIDDNQNLKRITESSFEHENASKVIFHGEACKVCGSSYSQELWNKSVKMHRKYENLQKLVFELKTQYKKITNQLQIFKKSLQSIIHTALHSGKMIEKLEQQEYPSKIQNVISIKPETMKQNEMNSQFSQCFQFVKNLQQDLIIQDISFSSISKNLKIKPFGIEESEESQKKKQNFKFNHDMSFSSIRSAGVGKIVKNIKRQNKKNQQCLHSLVNNEIKVLEKKFDLKLKQNLLTSDKNIMMCSGKSPQSPTKEPQFNGDLTSRSLKIDIRENREKKILGNQPLTSRNQQRLNFSSYSVSNSRCTKKQTKSCYDNIRNALSKLKQTLH